MKRVVKCLFLLALIIVLTGCASKPVYLEFYPPCTQEEIDAGCGSLKVWDCRKPAGAITIFGISLF